MADGPPLRLLRAVLRLLPREVRVEYAAEIEALVRRRRAALEAAGVLARIRFWTSELWGVVGTVAAAWLDRGAGFGSLARDVRFAVRSARRSPAISAVIALTLAVGIGATLTVVALMDGLLLHPVPVPEPDRVVRVYQALNETSPFAGTSYPIYQEYRRGSPSLGGPAGYTTLDVGLAAGEVTDRVSAGLVSGDYFGLLGVRAVVGRTLQPADDRPDAPHVLVLGHGLWERVFGADPGVVGRVIEISGAPFEVVGVAEEGFQGVSLSSAPEVWLPLSRIQVAASSGLYTAPNLFDTRAFAWISMVGRLEDGATAERARAELERVALNARRELGEDSGLPEVDRPVRVLPLEAAAAGTDRGGLLRFMGFLGGVVLITLVVACVNAAHLISARAWTRARELGVRRALGAGRGRLLRHLLAECVLLAVAGGGFGLLLAAGATRAVRDFVLPGDIPLARIDLTIDARLALAAVGLSLVTAVAFGLGPALGQTRGTAGAHLRTGDRGSPRRGRRLSLMITAQVGLALVLVVGAFLFARTLSRALGTELGFEPEGVAALSMAFRGQGYEVNEIPGILQRLVGEVEGAPGVEAAAFATHVPLSPPSTRLKPVPEEAADHPGAVMGVNMVTPGYFEVLGIPSVAGRGFSPADVEDAEEVAVVNEAAADILWPGESPLGRRLMLVRGLDPIRVVGVVADHKVHAVTDEDEPYVYLAAAQQAQLVANGVHFLARAGTDTRDALAALRGRIGDLDPGFPTWDARSVETQMDRVLMPQRFGALLLGLLSAVALLVSAMGVYGMVTFGVRRRTREIGIRLALGAGPGHVLRTVVGGTAVAVLVGIAVGTLLARLLTRFLERSLLLGVAPDDPVAFAAAVAVLGGVGVVAALIPARHAVAMAPRRAMLVEE